MIEPGSIACRDQELGVNAAKRLGIRVVDEIGPRREVETRSDDQHASGARRRVQTVQRTEAEEEAAAALATAEAMFDPEAKATPEDGSEGEAAATSKTESAEAPAKAAKGKKKKSEDE